MFTQSLCSLDILSGLAALSNSVCCFQWMSLSKIAATETLVHGPRLLTSWAVGINTYYTQIHTASSIIPSLSKSRLFFFCDIFSSTEVSQIVEPANPSSTLITHVTFHNIDISKIYYVLQIFVEAKRTAPSILYIPHIGQWWETVGPALRATFLSLLSSIPAFSPILLLATCNLRYEQLSMEVCKSDAIPK